MFVIQWCHASQRCVRPYSYNLKFCSSDNSMLVPRLNFKISTVRYRQYDSS